MLLVNTPYCVNLIGDGLSRYSSKIESVWFKKTSVGLLSLSY